VPEDHNAEVAQNQVRIRIWHKYYDEYPDEPDEKVVVEYDDPHVWQDDPWYDSGPTAFDIHPEDAPATLYIYTNDSVRAPHPSNLIEWGRPVERGLPFDPERYDDYSPFGCEVWGRVLFLVEEELTR